MKIFKFGGASVKDAESIKNVGRILNEFKGQKKIVVISAMGKTTNALEDVVNLYYKNDQKYLDYLHDIREYHQHVSEDLFANNAVVQHQIHALFDKIEAFCSGNISNNYNFIYDQIICVGELASTKLVAAYLNTIGIENKWVDARDLIRTDNAYTDAKIEWKITEQNTNNVIKVINEETIITQGFIGSTSERFTTTLGREGSDYTAAILAYCLEAEKMTIWKDVEGVMNADPKEFNDTVLIPKISYKEAIEMTYYGAKVIHPKTIRPLQNKNIPLEVRSFIKSDLGGTLISNFKKNEINYPPIIVRKRDQIQLTFSAKDFSFIAENHMKEIFAAFAEQRLRMNIMQNGAISFIAAVDNKKEKIDAIVSQLDENFKIKIFDKLDLLSIRHFNDEIVERELKAQTIWLTQKTQETIQVLFEV